MWHSNTDLASISAWLSSHAREGGKIAIITHTKPDGDAVGSSTAAARALNFVHPGAAECWYFGSLPPWLDLVNTGVPRRILDTQGLPSDAESPTAALIVDTGSSPQLDRAMPWLQSRAVRAAIVDHHAHGDANLASRLFVDTSAASVCLPVAELCRCILALPSAAALPVEVAEPLYLGLATDTGWFKYSSVSSRVLRLAAELIDAGARPNKLYEMIEQQEKPPRIRLLARALSSLELFEHGKVAVMSLTRADFAAAGAEQSDAGGFIDYPQTIASVRVGALLVEADESTAETPKTKISLRSKSAGRPEDGVNVNVIAQQFGGGGHIAAAGARAATSISDVKPRIVKALAEQIAARGL
jgi:bifunctional oligoribonuclease and PAP phosphatase NrnA